MQVNAILSATSQTPGSSYGKKINTTISHLRQSQENQARALGIALNALTTNHFENVQVNEIDITDFTPTPTKLYPNPHLTATPVQGQANTYNITLYSESSATPTVFGKFGSTTIGSITLTAQGNNYWGMPSSLSISSNSDLTAIIPENDDYYSASATIHIN